jgi:translocation and assembly module TamB
MKIYLTRLFWIICSLIGLAFLSAGYLFLNTQQGLILASKFAQQWLPGKLKIGELKGCLLGPIQMKELDYTSSDVALSISSVQLDWRWSYLLHGHFAISSLFIDKLQLAIKKNNVDPVVKVRVEKLKFPWFLKHIKLNSVDVKQMLVHYGSNFLTLHGSLRKKWQFNWQLIIPQLDNFISESKGQLVLQGKITGDRLFPKLDLFLAATDLTWQNWKLKQIQSEFHLDSVKQWVFNLKAAQFKNTTFSLNPIHINFSGNLKPFFLLGTVSRFKLARRIDVKRVYNIVIPTSEVTAKLSASGLEAKLITEPADAMQQLSAQIQFPRYQLNSWLNHKQAIQGNIQLTLKNLSYFAGFVPILKNSRGILDAKLNFSGSIFYPTIDLTLNLENGSTEISALGLFLKNINLTFQTDKNLLQGTGQLDSGKGSLTFWSQTRLDQKNFPSVIDLKANNLEISHTRKYKITASPELQAQANIHHITVGGFIVFPKAEIKIQEDNTNLVELSNDIIFSDQKNIVLPFTYKNDVKIQLGNDVSFSYRGLRTKVTGALTIDQTTDHPMLATGELALTAGTYTYYGQSLKLQAHSLLTFANSAIDNPYLDVSASKNVWVLPEINTKTDTTKFGSAGFISSALQSQQAIHASVGVRLQGYLENPKITLYADPANAINSQLDMLSYLVTGQPSRQLGAGSVQLLLSAVTGLSDKQSEFSQLINSAQKKIGIDQFTIGANPIFNPNTNSVQQNTSVIIGKNFSPRLNVSYSLGLLDPISILQINYLLNNHFSLQSTNSNFSNGIALLYKIERK